MKKIFHSVRGTCDFYPPQTFIIEKIIEKAKRIFEIFGYEPILLPHLEEEGLFKKGIGTTTDIVEKQMFKIESKDVVLRPEATAQVARFYIENSLHKFKDFHKFYYIGAMFRGERPQKGRLREFHHIGAEAIGSENFYLDAEIIDVSLKILKASGIDDLSLKINSLGCAKDKNKLSDSIKRKLRDYESVLCPDCKKRLTTSPLRILDCKKNSCQKIVSSLNIKSQHLCEGCHSHFFGLLAFLDELKIKYVYQPLLVRGLDYYTNTVFEITTCRLGSQDALGAGGRYNNLIYDLAGRVQIPAIGFALGLERMLLVSNLPKEYSTIKVGVACTSSDIYRQAYKLTQTIRDEGVGCDIDYKGKSLKAQLKNFQKLGVPLVVIVGDAELKEGCIILRDMRESRQEKVKLEELRSIIKERLGA